MNTASLFNIVDVTIDRQTLQTIKNQTNKHVGVVYRRIIATLCRTLCRLELKPVKVTVQFGQCFRLMEHISISS